MGTPGHMAHPFDVEKIQTGDDLLDYINSAITKLAAGEIAGSVKWDGINTSFKLITDEDGKKDFRMDRGSNHIDSVVGLDAAAAYKKWPKGHGMPPAIEKLLSIFNQAIPIIEPELKTLGMWDDPTKYFNTEYIEGTSNVQDYNANILAIHGINQFYEKRAQPHAIRKGISMDRPGLPRPLDNNGKPIKGGGIEIDFDHQALEQLIRKVQPYAAEYDFQIFGDVPVSFDPEMELDIEAVLDSPISIQLEQGNIKRATLREWLKTVKHPKDKKILKIIRDENGTPTGTKPVGALSKDIYMAVLRSAEEGGVPLNDYLKDAQDISSAIDGGIFYHATRLLGQAVKNVLTSEAGNLERHEGVVLRGLENFLVKLTGDFIVQGLASTHGNHVSEHLEQDFTVQISKNKQITKTIAEWLTEIKAAGHKHQKLPQMVYKGVLAGTPIIDIVVQGDAERTIYNAVMDYASNLNEQSEDAIELDIVADDDVAALEDESGDPVVDVDAPGQTIALVPGAFKPPHRGHADMVRRYATGDGVQKADRTIILISNPEGAKRTLPHDGSEVSAEHSERIWETVFSDVTSLPGVEVRVADSEMRSPISIAYEYISETTPLDIRAGDNVILGASRKDRDYERWNGAAAWKKKKRGINVLAGEEYAVPAAERSDNKPFSASDSRQLISNLTTNPEDVESLRALAEYIPQDKIDKLFNILGQPSPVSNDLEEISAMGMGALTVGTGKKRKKPSIVRRENKQTVDDVIRLLMERGIMS